MAKTKLLRYNCKNVKYAIKKGETYGEVLDLAFVDSISLEPQYDEAKIYGDGEVIAIIPNDKGLVGKLKVLSINEDFEIACGRLMKLEGGSIASVQQRLAEEFAIYFEVDALDETGKIMTIKNWLLGVSTGKPAETFNQNTDAPQINLYEYDLTIMGELLKNGQEVAIDPTTGNTVKVYQMKSAPTAKDYATFDKTVPTPTAPTQKLN